MGSENETIIGEEPLSPAARMFQSPAANIHIIVKIGCKTRINPSIIKAGFQETLIKHPRFCSKMVWCMLSCVELFTIIDVVSLKKRFNGCDTPHVYTNDIELLIKF